MTLCRVKFIYLDDYNRYMKQDKTSQKIKKPNAYVIITRSQLARYNKMMDDERSSAIILDATILGNKTIVDGQRLVSLVI